MVDKGVGATALRGTGASALGRRRGELLLKSGWLKSEFLSEEWWRREALETAGSDDLREPGVRDLLTEVQLYR